MPLRIGVLVCFLLVAVVAAGCRKPPVVVQAEADAPEGTRLLTTKTKNAQQKTKPADTVRLLVEAGPDRECATQIGFIKAHMWGRRTTFSDNRVEYSVRFSVGNFATVLSTESVSDFIGFAKQVEEKRKGLQIQKPAEAVWIKWQTKDFEGSQFQLSCSMSDGVWVYDDAELRGLVATFEQALKDIEGIKANKARVPW